MLMNTVLHKVNSYAVDNTSQVQRTITCKQQDSYFNVYKYNSILLLTTAINITSKIESGICAERSKVG